MCLHWTKRQIGERNGETGIEFIAFIFLYLHSKCHVFIGTVLFLFKKDLFSTKIVIISKSVSLHNLCLTQYNCVPRSNQDFVAGPPK